MTSFTASGNTHIHTHRLAAIRKKKKKKKKKELTTKVKYKES